MKLIKADSETYFNRGIDDTSGCPWELNFCFMGHSPGLVMIQCCCNTDLCNDGGFTNSTPSTPLPSVAVTVFDGSALSLMTLLLVGSNYL
jgi:hypothetical protein